MKRIAAILLSASALLCARAQATDLLTVWRAAQPRDAAYVAARQSLLLAQAPAQQRQARERLRLAEQDLALRVARAYFEVMNARHGAELALDQLNLMAQQLRSAQRAGDAAGLHQAQQRFDAARTARVAALRDLERSRAELEKMAGRVPAALAALPADAPVWSPEPADAQFWMAEAAQDHPRVRLSLAALEAAGDEVERRRDGAGPNVDITASRSRLFNDIGPATPGEIAARARSAQLGLILTVPLEDVAPDSRVREAVAVHERAQADLAVHRSLAMGPARQAFDNAMQALARSQALTAAARAGRTAVDAARAGLRSGIRVSAELLASAQLAFTLERDWLRARTEAVMQGLALKAAAGRLDERELAGVNTLLAAPRDEAAP